MRVTFVPSSDSESVSAISSSSVLFLGDNDPENILDEP